MADAVGVARRIADGVLFPAAMEVDRADRIPATHFESLVDAGFYGLAAPAAVGGPEVDFPTFGAAATVVAAGSTSITRDQHPRRLVREAAFLLVFGSRPQLRTALLQGLVR
jgi:alkylation response protein AidB-like acyl-CoA dehydrogenase